MNLRLFSLIGAILSFAAVMWVTFHMPAAKAQAATQPRVRFVVVGQYQVNDIGRTLAVLRDTQTGACFLYAKDEPGMYAGAGSITATSQDVCSEVHP